MSYSYQDVGVQACLTQALSSTGIMLLPLHAHASAHCHTAGAAKPAPGKHMLPLSAYRRRQCTLTGLPQKTTGLLTAATHERQHKLATFTSLLHKYPMDALKIPVNLPP